MSVNNAAAQPARLAAKHFEHTWASPIALRYYLLIRQKKQE
jgi:hypothetical protein